MMELALHQRIYLTYSIASGEQIKPRSRRESGTGLGMSIAQAIAVRHGGKITVQSGTRKRKLF